MSKANLQGNPKQIDQSTIPPAVRRAAAEADRLLTAEVAARNGDAPPPAPTNPEPPPAPANEPPRATHPEPAPQPPQDRPQPTHPTNPKPDDEATWEQRARSAMGREQKLRQDLEHLSGEVSNLRSVLATVQATAPAAPSEMHFERPKLVTDAEIAEWTPELIGVIERKAREIAEPEIARVTKMVEDLGGRVSNVGQSIELDARQKMLNALDNDERLTGWRIQNDDQDFVQWLKYPDPMSGQVRKDMLLSAFNSNDAARVAAFFLGFRKEAAAVAPRDEPQPRPGEVTPPKPSLESFAAPGRTRSAPNPTGQGEEETITRADIARFYADSAAGRFKGREAEAKAYEAQIFKAQREGRIAER